MSYEIVIDTKANFFLKKLSKTAPKDFDKIDYFLANILSNTENPLILPNCKKLVGFSDNRYRWRLGNYRIIGIVKNDTFELIQIVKISKRDENTYKSL